MMNKIAELDKIAINVKSHKLLRTLLHENPELEEILRESKNETEAIFGVKELILEYLEKRPAALKFYKKESTGRNAFEKLSWRDFAAIRIIDYTDNADTRYKDLNLRGEVAVSNPVKLLWLAVTYGTGGARPGFFVDMIKLFRQFSGKSPKVRYTKGQVIDWMEKWPSGLDLRIVKLREENRNRIINILIEKIDKGEIQDKKYYFPERYSQGEKFKQMLSWWNEKSFHLRFAIRDPDLLNEMLGHSLDPDTMKVLYQAKEVGIPFFINPYYLSLLHVRVPYFAIGADLAIRHYILYSQQLVNEFGHIIAWEKEDTIEPGKPNAAGWLLPSHHNVHRRYPEVAILIPDTVGRACGGLCASCQRMYDFQRGNLNFKLEKLQPKSNWSDRLKQLINYWENDTQLRDILITGGDALMSSDRSLREILDAIYVMAKRKKEANRQRSNGQKYAEILRVRIGTRLPVYLPQRINKDLLDILKEFKENAATIGIKQFIIQTHFESPMEVTPEAQNAVANLIAAGWTVTNQLVLTSAASRRGHSSKLRQALNDIGVLSYYTFSVKGYMENTHNFATNERAVQEQLEEKSIGRIPSKYYNELKEFPLIAEEMVENIDNLRKKARIPYLATDRNVLNLPGVGKSLTYRVIGITRYGRRILEFDHDHTRNHSPVIDKLGKVIIVESKSVHEYLQQLEDMGEDISQYANIFGYSIGETEPRLSLYEYPKYDFETEKKLSNFEI